MTAHPVQIVNAGEGHTFTLDEDELNEILLEENIRNRDVVVISVAGAFRKGKSFLLDFFLRYLYAKYVHHSIAPEWLGEDEEPLVGFSWRGGAERDTTGILMWSDIFLHDSKDQKLAIILMDTQGTFDSQSTVKQCATVFALSTMLSSVQIYNLSQNIQEDDLQHLQLFTEYGRLAIADSGKKPFQRLQFLVRDWSFPYEAEYGSVGGDMILQRRLEISDKQHPDLQSLRRHISSCFREIECFLMPHPGLNVATNPKFDGRLADITVEFKQSLKELVPMLLAPENLKVKEINGQKVKARDLVQYFKSYLAMFRSNEMPEPKTMLLATAEANNLNAVASAKDTYTQMMEDCCGGKAPYKKPDLLEIEHLRAKDKAIFQFTAKRKMGGEEFSEIYKNQLESDLDEVFLQYRDHNESKNVFKAAQTPSVFLCISFATYILSGICAMFGLETFCNFFTLLMGLSFIALALWGYIRYSGEFTNLGMKLDFVADTIWGKVLQPIWEGCMEKGIKRVATEVAMSAATGTPISTNLLRQNSSSSTPNGKPKRS